MTIQDPAPVRSRNLERLLTFVDAIVAIAVTLLILPLAELAGSIEPGVSIWATVQEHAGEFLSFVLSFVVITRLWLAQHRVVRGAVDSSRWLNSGLLTWSATIVFLPFPTALLANNGEQPATKIFYIGTLALSSLLLSGLALAVRSQLPKGAPARPHVAPSLIDAALFVLALIVCLLAPGWSYYPLLLLFLSGPLERIVKRLRVRDDATPRGDRPSER